MRVKEVVAALERFAPLPLQESYDNAGLQIGLTEADEVSGALFCLDVTEDVVREAAIRGCNLIIAHHPLLFRGLKRIDGSTQPDRVTQLAIKLGIAVYAAHTNLDNARGGVNWHIAAQLGLEEVDFLLPRPDGAGGSGVIASLPQPEAPEAFLRRIKKTFGVACLMHNVGPERDIRRVALCGGAGESLLDEAIRQGADLFLTGEMGYHRYAGHEDDLWIAVLGHYQSEQFTIGLMRDIVADACPGLPLAVTDLCTNPVRYL